MYVDLPRIRNPERFQNDEDFLEHMEFGLVYGDYGKPTLKSVTNRQSKISTKYILDLFSSSGAKRRKSVA